MAENGSKVWCWVKKRVVTTGVFLGAVVTITVALGALDQYRWWVWASEFRVVAKRVYETTIPEQHRVVSSINRRLERAKDVPPRQRDSKDDQKINDLEADLKAEEQKLDLLIDERARFKPR